MYSRHLLAPLVALGVILTGCGVNLSQSRGLEIKLLLGSALDDFCEQAITRFNQQNPTLQDGQPFFATCEAKGSGDVVTTLTNLAQRYQSGQIQAESPEFPTLLSVDGEIYHSQLIYRMNQLFPGQDYIPSITDSPLLAHSPMVLMTTTELAPGLQQVDDLYQTLVNVETHQEIDPASPPIPVHFVHTAPTRSNSGLQTLVAQFASVSGKRPEDLTLADVQTYQADVAKIQNKITRYGVSTSSLARSMAQNGVFWASIGSVYESLVIRVNSQAGSASFQAVYPQATFSSNMRAIVPNAPWVSPAEQAAAEQIIDFLRDPQTQEIALQQGLRPGTVGVPLGPQFSASLGVEANPQYDSYRPPDPEVVAAMIEAWQTVAKKASRVVVIVDSSGSMAGNKISSVQQTLQTYIDNLGPREEVALIDFDSMIRDPVLVDGSEAGRNEAIQFIASLEAEGGTLLYDATLAGQRWLQQNLRPDAINAVLVLTDGNDSGSSLDLAQLLQTLETTGFTSDQRIAFFTIGYGRQGDFNASVLEAIANQNGGYYSKGDPDTIAQLMERLQLEF